MTFTQQTFEDIYGAVQDEIQDTTATTLTLIKKLINRIYRRLQTKLARIKRNYYLISTSVSIVAGTQEYDIVDDWSITDFKEFVMIKDGDGNRIFKGDLRRNKYGYYFLGLKKMGFIDTPSASATYTLYYLKQQSTLSGTTDVPEIPLGSGDIFIEGTCWLYYRLKKRKALAVEYKALYLGLEAEMLVDIAEDESDEIKEVERTDDHLEEELSD